MPQTKQQLCSFLFPTCRAVRGQKFVAFTRRDLEARKIKVGGMPRQVAAGNGGGGCSTQPAPVILVCDQGPLTTWAPQPGVMTLQPAGMFNSSTVSCDDPPCSLLAQAAELERQLYPDNMRKLSKAEQEAFYDRLFADTERRARNRWGCMGRAGVMLRCLGGGWWWRRRQRLPDLELHCCGCTQWCVASLGTAGCLHPDSSR